MRHLNLGNPGEWKDFVISLFDDGCALGITHTTLVHIRNSEKESWLKTEEAKKAEQARNAEERRKEAKRKRKEAEETQRNKHERELFAEFMASPTLLLCERYLNEFPGTHNAGQVRNKRDDLVEILNSKTSLKAYEAHKGKIKAALACPRCGAYKWDGAICNHCEYSKPRAGRKDAEKRKMTVVGKLAGILVVAVLLGLAAVLILVRLNQDSPTGGDLSKYDQKQFQVHRVVDGDTIDLKIPDSNRSYTRVRLWGLDTPETKAPGKPIGYFGPEATAFTENMVGSEKVTIEIEPENARGKFGRLLAFVYTSDGKMLNEELLRTGHAYADGRWRHRFYFRFQHIENQARKDKRGLWLNVKTQDMPAHVRQRLGLNN